MLFFFFFFNAPPTTEIYTFPYTTLFRSGEPPDVLQVEVAQHHGTLGGELRTGERIPGHLLAARDNTEVRSEEHTSELQSHVNLVCRLLLEKKKKKKKKRRMKRNERHRKT